jgi:murein DD-endopeptidase MepM/ murein hydrolase activator NlpD
MAREGRSVQIIITDARLARSRSIQLSGVRLAALALASLSVLLLLAFALSHWVMLKGAREGWPVVGSLLGVVARDDMEERDRFMRANLDAMAKRLGEMQVRMAHLQSLDERVLGLAGLPSTELSKLPGRGGALVAARPLSLEELDGLLGDLGHQADRRVDLLTVLESRLFDQHIRKRMIPTQAPVQGKAPGSSFGWRIDPFTGQSALHTGLDFAAETGAPILAAAGGVVTTQEYHPAYGNMVEIDHGNQVVTRYAHASKTMVARGDLVRRGQKIAEVGTTGRSTGAHLHFEVLVQGVFQDPQKFLAAGEGSAGMAQIAGRSQRGAGR